jgi:hypothetical protein
VCVRVCVCVCVFVSVSVSQSTQVPLLWLLDLDWISKLILQ